MIDFEQLEYYLNSPYFDSDVKRWEKQEEKEWEETRNYLSSRSFEIELKFIKTRARLKEGISNIPNTNTVTEENTIKAFEKVFNALEKTKRETKKIGYTEIEGVTVMYFTIPNFIFQKFLQVDENGEFYKRMIYTG
jgi:hypothetical protein